MDVPSFTYILAMPDSIIQGAYPESPSYHKNTLWERLPAAKLNDRGWKPLPLLLMILNKYESY